MTGTAQELIALASAPQQSAPSDVERLSRKLMNKLYAAVRSQEEDVKVNGPSHPGLLEPMLGILRDTYSDAEALIAAVGQLDIERLTAERDEADRRAGAAERHNAHLEDSARRRERWLREAKAAAGYHDNVSFDVVWADALAALKTQQITSAVPPISSDDERRVAVSHGTANSHVFDDAITVNGEPVAFAGEPWSTRIAELLSVGATQCELIEALRPFARLQLPKKREGNASFYSIYLSDIERARNAIGSLKEGERR